MHSFHREQKSAIGKTDLSSRSVNLRVLIIGRESKAPGSCGTSPQGPLTIQDLCTPRRMGSLSPMTAPGHNPVSPPPYGEVSCLPCPQHLIRSSLPPFWNSFFTRLPGTHPCLIPLLRNHLFSSGSSAMLPHLSYL